MGNGALSCATIPPLPISDLRKNRIAHLCIEHRRLTGKECAELCSAAISCKSLRVVTIANVTVPDVSNLEPLHRIIAENAMIHTVNGIPVRAAGLQVLLRDGQASVAAKGSRALALLLQTSVRKASLILSPNEPLQQIDLSDCGLGAEVAEGFLAAICGSTTLECLSLRGNDLQECIPSLQTLIALSCPQLTDLDISDNNFTEDQPNLCEALRKNGSLKCFDYSKNNDRSGEVCVSALEGGGLRALSARNCGFGPQGCISVIYACQQLEMLDLSDNQVHPAALSILSSFLEDCECNIRTLKLKRIRTTSLALEKIFMACLHQAGAHLSSPHPSDSACIHELEVDGNPLEETAVKALAGCLRSPGCQLKEISASSCRLSSKSFSTIGNALADGTPAIQMLNVYSNPRADVVSRVALIRAAQENNARRVQNGTSKRLILLVHKEPRDDGKMLKTLTTPGMDQTVGRGYLT